MVGSAGFWLYLLLDLDLGRSAIEEWGWGIWVAMLIVSILIGGAVQVYRYRRVAGTIQRQRTRLVLFGLGDLAGALWTRSALRKADAVPETL